MTNCVAGGEGRGGEAPAVVGAIGTEFETDFETEGVSGEGVWGDSAITSCGSCGKCTCTFRGAFDNATSSAINDCLAEGSDSYLIWISSAAMAVFRSSMATAFAMIFACSCWLRKNIIFVDLFPVSAMSVFTIMRFKALDWPVSTNTHTNQEVKVRRHMGGDLFRFHASFSVLWSQQDTNMILSSKDLVEGGRTLS